VLREFDQAAYAPQSDEKAQGKGAARQGKPAATSQLAAEKNPVTQQTPGQVSTGRSYGGGAMMASGAVAVDGKTDPEDVGQKAFFRTMKELTLVGYYTSEPGSTQELHVMPMGPYKGDIPLAQVGRAWA
jgi:hypothetical protein